MEKITIDEDALYIAIGSYFGFHDVWYDNNEVKRYEGDIDEDEFMDQFLGVLDKYYEVVSGADYDSI